MGTVFTHELWYAPTERSCTLHVYLPEGYDDSDERYPVMYFFDGHNLFFDEMATFGKSWGLRDFLDRWEKPLIVVGMECNHEGDLRLHEYCPYRAHAFGSDIDGLGDETLRWIVDEVKPWADATLRTWPHRAATGIGGSSMGGLARTSATSRGTGASTPTPASTSPGASRSRDVHARGQIRRPRVLSRVPRPTSSAASMTRESTPIATSSGEAATTRPAGSSRMAATSTISGATSAGRCAGVSFRGPRPLSQARSTSTSSRAATTVSSPAASASEKRAGEVLSRSSTPVTRPPS